MRVNFSQLILNTKRENKSMASSSSHATTSITEGSMTAITGSTVEKQAYVRHMANRINQEIDIMIVEGSINCQDALIPMCNRFLQVRFD